MKSSDPPRKAPDRNVRHRFWRRWRLLALAPIEYFWNFRWKKQWHHAEFFGSVWHSGWVGRCILVSLLGLALLAPFAISLQDPLVPGNLAAEVNPAAVVLSDNVPIGLICFGLFLLAWSLATAALSCSPVWLYCLGGSYLITTTILILGAAHYTFWHVLPLTWIWLVAVWKVFKPLPGERWGWIWLLFFSYYCGWVFGGPSGLRLLIWGSALTPDFVDSTQRWLGWSAVGLGAICVGVAFWRRHRKIPAGQESRKSFFGSVWIGSALVMAVALAVCLLRDRFRTQAALFDQSQYLGFFSMYFFVWTGGGFAGGSLKLGEWTTRRAVHVLTPGISFRLFVVLLVITLVAEAAIGYPEWSFLQDLLTPHQWGWAAVRDAGFIQATRWHFVVTLGTLLILAGRWLRRGAGRWIFWLACWWGTLFLMCLAFWNTSTEMVRQYENGSRNVFVGVSGFVVLLGLIWEGGHLRRSDKAAPEERWKELAWLASLLSLTICLQSFNRNQFITVQSLALAQGMFYLALLRLGYSWISKTSPGAGSLQKGTEVACFAFGILAVCPLLYWHPWDAWCLPWFLPIILAAVVVLRWIRPALDRSGLAYAGGLMAAGAVCQCYFRGFPELPVNPWIAYADYRDAQEIMVSHPLFPFTLQHVILLSGMVFSGLAAGWLVGRYLPAWAVRKAATPRATMILGKDNSRKRY